MPAWACGCCPIRSPTPIIELHDIPRTAAVPYAPLRVAGVRGRLRGVDTPSGRGPASEAPVHHLDVAQRAAGDPVRGSLDAHRARVAVVPRRVEERAAGTHRVRPFLRAHDVQG